jgi:hypothetical protein
MFNDLEDCDTLFQKFFSPWYFEDERPNTTRPDMYVVAGYSGRVLDLNRLQYLDDEILIQSVENIRMMTGATMDDYRKLIHADGLSLAVLDAVDKKFDRQTVSDLILVSDPDNLSNPYMVSVCEFGIMLGYLFTQRPDFGWLYGDPYFHSVVVHTPTGLAIPVFDWAVKKFSNSGIDEGVVEKYHAAIQAAENPKN